MDPINTWLDASEVRHLAEQLLRPVAPARIPSADLGFDSSFVGFIKQDQPPSLDESPDSKTDTKIAPVEKSVTTESIDTASTQPAPASPSQSSPLDRIQIFRDWLATNFKATDIFILDREGKVIFDESSHGRLHFMARNLALSSRNSGHIHIQIGPSSIMEVIPCETPYGRFVLGTLVPESLPPVHIKTIIEALIQATSPE